MKKINKYINGYLKTKFSKSQSLAGLCLQLSVIIGVAFSFSSCKKFVEIPPPTSQLVTGSVFNNNAAATAALTNIYVQMFSNSESSYITNDNGNLADELTAYGGPNSPYYPYYINLMNAGNSSSGGGGGDWNGAYSYIYQANAIIAGLQQYSGTSAAVKHQLTGEAYFIRAFWYFYLTAQYGGVPLALTTDYTVTSKLSRSTRVQVLGQVIADLQTAKGLLSNNYVDASDTTKTTDRVRPNKAVVIALLARAYLYLGDYDNNNAADYTKADSAATAVISNSTYSLCTNLSGSNSPFLANSTEAIWQLDTPLPNTVNTYDGYNFILLAAPSTNNLLISPQLLNAFEPYDQREVNWIGSITEGGTTYYFPYKYKTYTYDGTEYTMVLRLAEQYLIRAEAEAELNQPAAAVSDLNVIRKRAGLPNYSGGTDQASLLTAILHERQVELFTEWGHRWFDLNRALKTKSTVNVNTVLGTPGNVCQAKGGIWDPSGYQILYPIPLTELQVDFNLTQNPGY